MERDDHVRIDLSNVRFVDTDALEALWALQELDVEVTLYGPPALFGK